MGRKSGDKARYFVEKRKKHARRVEMRAYFGKVLDKEPGQEVALEAVDLPAASASDT